MNPPLGFRSIQAASPTDVQYASRSAQLDQLIQALALALAPSSIGATTADVLRSSNPQVAGMARQTAYVRRLRWRAILGAIFLVIGAIAFVYWNNNRTSDAQKTTTDKSVNTHRPLVPATAGAKRKFEALTEGDLLATGGDVQEFTSDGTRRYFGTKVAPGGRDYAEADVQIKNEVQPHYFASVKLRAGPGIGTLELQGRNVWFLVDSTYEHYMIWNVEGNQTSWLPIPIKIDRQMNTLGIYQIGRQVHVYFNSTYVDSFQLWNEPSLGRVGLHIKANAKSGGEAEFERLTVWEF